MRLQYGRILQDRLDGEHGLPRRLLEERAAEVRAGRLVAPAAELTR